MREIDFQVLERCTQLLLTANHKLKAIENIGLSVQEQPMDFSPKDKNSLFENRSTEKQSCVATGNE